MQLGSLVPSSRYLVNNLLSRIDWKRAGVIVEYGPGIGNMTQEILKRMRPDATLVAIEMNPDFVRFIDREVQDRRSRPTPRCQSSATTWGRVAQTARSKGPGVESRSR